MALVFGIPLEVAHGGWRAALIMQAGVVAGALSCAVFDADRRVVGASASCYALLGAHVAIIALHWRSMKRGLLHRDVRIAVFAALAFCDVLTTADRAANVGARAELESSTRLQCARTRTACTRLFGRASRI